MLARGVQGSRHFLVPFKPVFVTKPPWYFCVCRNVRGRVGEKGEGRGRKRGGGLGIFVLYTVSLFCSLCVLSTLLPLSLTPSLPLSAQHVDMCVRAHARVCLCVHECVHTDIQTDRHRYRQTHIHEYIHTHTTSDTSTHR